MGIGGHNFQKPAQETGSSPKVLVITTWCSALQNGPDWKMLLIQERDKKRLCRYHTGDAMLSIKTCARFSLLPFSISRVHLQNSLLGPSGELNLLLRESEPALFSESKKAKFKSRFSITHVVVWPRLDEGIHQSHSITPLCKWPEERK